MMADMQDSVRLSGFGNRQTEGRTLAIQELLSQLKKLINPYLWFLCFHEIFKLILPSVSKWRISVPGGEFLNYYLT